MMNNENPKSFFLFVFGFIHDNNLQWTMIGPGPPADSAPGWESGERRDFL